MGILGTQTPVPGACRPHPALRHCVTSGQALLFPEPRSSIPSRLPVGPPSHLSASVCGWRVSGAALPASWEGRGLSLCHPGHLSAQARHGLDRAGLSPACAECLCPTPVCLELLVCSLELCLRSWRTRVTFSLVVFRRALWSSGIWSKGAGEVMGEQLGADHLGFRPHRPQQLHSMALKLIF